MIKRLTVIFVCLAFFVSGAPALAAPQGCEIEPSGTRPEGAIVYNNDYNVLQYCDGTAWKAIAWNAGGGCFTNWIKRTAAGLRVWQGIASSSDNQNLVAIVWGGHPYTSTDGGVTWTERDTANRDWEFVASSADGQKLVGVVASGRPYTSADGGQSWTERDSTNRNWRGVASSADGQKLVAVVENGRPYTSIDGGQNWTQQDTGNRAWYGVASSADGQKLIGTVGGDYMYRSTNGGANWSAVTSGGQGWWESVASSADGSVLFATRDDDAAYISTDSGATWHIHPDMPDDDDGLYRAIAVSADGSTVAVARRGGNIEIADANGGNLRIGGFPSGFKGSGIALSLDGKKIATAASTTDDDPGYIYTAECTGSSGTGIGGAPDCTDDATATCTLDADRDSGDPQLVAANIADGVNILGVTGTLAEGLSGPAGCATIGALCADGTVFAGYHPVTQEQLFIPTTDQGTTSAWKTSTGTNDIATDSTYDGWANSNQVPNSTAFPAFKLCKDLGTGGHSDWYLPGRVEMYYLWGVHEMIEAGGNITNFQDFSYWSSSENNNNVSSIQDFASGGQSGNGKTAPLRVRCMRR